MARSLQKARFWIYYWPRWALQLPFPAILLPVGRRTALGSYGGITICSATFSQISGKQFLERTIEALQLVERIDPRRFRRIQQHIRFIVHGELASGACYWRLGRVCIVDFGRYDFATDHDWYLHSYASALVHEATHGAIYSRYIAYLARNRLRIEKLCHTEERRFLQGLDTPDRSWSDQLAGVFDEQYFVQYFSANWLSRMRGMRKRIAEVRKDA
jgi:hypothetical protein